MTSKLGLYNAALLEVGEKSLASLSESRAPRFALDQAWDDTIGYVLEQGLWNCAMRSQEIPASTTLIPDFGYTYAFEQPDDMVRLAAICSDAEMNSTIETYADERGYWWANIDTIYVGFVSDDVTYGMDLSKWPHTLARYAALELASRICVRDTASEAKLERIKKDRHKALIDARSKDAMASPSRQAFKSRWVQARMVGSRMSGTGRGL